MTEKEKRRFTVISNTDINILESEQDKERERLDNYNEPFKEKGYQTNPMYEKLLSFQELQKKKRFTVEDLLKW